MAKVTINPPSTDFYPPSTRDFTTEHGDSFKTIVDKLNAMFTELYASISAPVTQHVTLRGPDTDYRLPNTRDFETELGDTYSTVVTQVNAMFAEIYGMTGGTTVAKVTIRAPSISGWLPNTGSPSVEHGDSLRAAIVSMNAMFTECYANADSGVPTNILLTSTAMSTADWLGKELATVAAIPAADYTYTLLNDASGQFDISGTHIRNMAVVGSAGTTYGITVRAARTDTPSIHLDKAFTVTVNAATMPTGLIARWDTMDASKFTLNGSKVAAWVDKINGFTLSEATDNNRPTWDSSNKTPNGLYNGVTFARANSQRLTSTDASLVSLINANNANFTIVVAVTSSNIAYASSPSEIISIGTTDAGQVGGARNYLIWRQAIGSAQWAILLGDQNTGITSVDGTAFSPAPTAGFGFFSVRSDGVLVAQGFDHQHDAGAVTAAFDDAKTSNTFSLGRRVTGAVAGSTGTYWDGQAFAVLVFNRTLSHGEINTAMDLLSVDLGHTLAAPTYLDLSNYTLDFDDDFTNATPYQSTQAGDVAASNWIPYYTAAAKNQYGSGPAAHDGAAWMGDPRDPLIAPYNLITTSDSILSMRSIPRPVALSGLTLNNPDGVATTYLGCALVSMGHFNIQDGYTEFRIKGPPSASGNFPAGWHLASTGRNGEIDTYEMYGAEHADVMQPAFHNDPYWPLYSGVDVALFYNGLLGSCPIDDLTADFHLLGVDIQGDGIRFYYDRKLLGRSVPNNGITAIAVSNGGSGLLADNGTANGTMAIKTLAGVSKEMAGNLTISSGVATLATVTNPGGGFASLPSVLRTTTGLAIGGGVVLSLTQASDPFVPPNYRTPLYILLDFERGSFTGTPDGGSYTFYVDYIRHYSKNITAPAVVSGLQPETTAIVNRMTAVGSTPSAGRQTTLNDLICFLKRWNNLRDDTVPMGPHTSDWDVNKLSLWDALEGLRILMFQDANSALIECKNPGAGTDGVINGSPVFTANQGYTFNGTIGQYIDTQINLIGSGLFQGYDSHMGVRMRTAPSNGSLASIMGSGTNCFLEVSSASHNWRLETNVDPVSPLTSLGTGFTKKAPGASHLVVCRGWRFHQQSWKNGGLQPLFSGYVSGGSIVTTGVGNMLIGARTTGAAGAACQLKVVHWGRRLFPQEVAKLNEGFAAFEAAW